MTDFLLLLCSVCPVNCLETRRDRRPCTYSAPVIDHGPNLHFVLRYVNSADETPELSERFCTFKF